MKYFIYTRKSTDSEERQVLSIESQISELKEFAAKEKLEIVASLSEAKTAKEPGRTVFGEMLDRIEKGEAQGILAWHPFMSISQFFYIRPVSVPVFLRA